MSWKDIEDAMHGVVVRSSGLSPDRVLWGYQDFNEPPHSYVAMHFGGMQGVGIDRIHTTQDLTRPNGQEIRQQVVGIRKVPFEFQCFSESTNGDGTAREIAEQIRSKFRLDTSTYALQKVQVSVFDNSAPINYVPYIPAANFRGRATCVVWCYVPLMDCYEYVGYIARVRGMMFPRPWVGPSGASGFSFDSAAGMSGFGG